MTDAAHPFRHAVFLTGPTASGKTAVGVALAKRLDAEILALDSMTLYRGMDIGTAKPTEAERGGVPHHLIDVLDPWEAASVADYREWALAAARDVESRGRRALFVGGTALYLKALLRGLFDGPPADHAMRRSLEAEADAIGDAALHARLAALDPAMAARLYPGDRRRVVRALEVLATTGRPLSAQQTSHGRPAEGVRVFALGRPRDELCERIDRRVAAMFAGGLIEETRALRSGPRPWNPIPAKGVGYREAVDVLEGRASLAGALERARIRTRQFAKRQRTWFRNLSECHPWPIPTDEAADDTADRLAGAIS